MSTSVDHVVIPEGRTKLTAIEAAAYIRSRSLEGFYKWFKRHRVPHESKGRELLFRRSDLDAALRPKDAPKPTRYFQHRQYA